MKIIRRYNFRYNCPKPIEIYIRLDKTDFRNIAIAWDKVTILC